MSEAGIKPDSGRTTWQGFGNAILVVGIALCGFVIGGVSIASAQTLSERDHVIFQNAHIIIGDGSVIESGFLELRNGEIAQLSTTPIETQATTIVIDASGKTIMPAMIDGHSHLGYQGRSSWGAENYTVENLVDNLEQYAYYGFSAVFSAGSDAPNMAAAVEVAGRNGEFVGAEFLYAAGMAPPGQGPNDLFLGHALEVEARAGETILYGLDNPEQARTQVQIAASKGIKFIKIWVDDRGGSQLKLAPEIYRSVIAAANELELKVFVHQQFAEDMPDLINAGTHGFLHGRIGGGLGEATARLARENEVFIVPNWGLGELRREAIGDDEFLNQLFSNEVMSELTRGNGNRSATVTRNEQTENELRRSFESLLEAGVDIVLGTDAGAVPNHPFGYTGHRELEIYVRLGMSPMQAILTATSNAARHLGLENRGTLQAGKSADILLLEQNPLENIRNTRTIERVILGGNEVERDRLRNQWKP